MEIVTCPQDLVHVNQKLEVWEKEQLGSPLCQSNSQKPSSRTRPSFRERVLIDFLESDMHKSRKAVKGSVKGRARSSTAKAEQKPNVNFIIQPSEFFRGVEPPSSILEAYTRLNLGQASTEDEIRICEYRETHCSNPRRLKTEPVKVHCVVFDPKIYDVVHQDELYRTEKRADEQSTRTDRARSQEARSHRAVTSRGPTISSTKQDSGRPNWRRLRPADVLPTEDTKIKRIQGLGNICGEMPDLRRMPKREELRRAQLQIQSRIINAIAEQPSVTSPESEGSTEQSRSRFCRPARVHTTESATSATRKAPTISTQDKDWQLEVHAAAILTIDQTLKDGSFKTMTVLNKQGTQLENGEKYDCLEAIQLIIERSFEEIVGEMTNQYNPSGKSVGEGEVGELLEDYVSTYDMLRDVYPKMKVKHIVAAFKKLGMRARLGDVY